MNKPRASKDKHYEDKHKDERKAKSTVWGTSLPKEKADEINAFLQKYGFTKVQLIEEGYNALVEQATERDLSLGKIVDSYDDFFGVESEKPTKDKNARK